MKKTISKKKRILRNLLLIVLILAGMDFLSGTAFLFPEIQFRREERANLLGPSRIIGTEEVDLGPFEKLFIADADDGVILWLWGKEMDRTQLVYREKYGEHMLVAAPGTLGYMFVTDELHLPLVLFDSQPKAARAELCFTLETNYNGEDFRKEYNLSAERTAAGYFLFTLNAKAESPWGLEAEGAAIQQFANVSANLEASLESIVPVEVRFYDVLDHRIGEETIEVRSGASLNWEESKTGAG